MDLTCPSSNDSEDILLNEGMLPVELQTPNIVHPSYHAIVTPSPNIINGRGAAEVFNENNGEPFVTIIEQPQQRGFRFRYECEGPSHGGLQGMKSERGKKSFPTIKIENYSGPARVVVQLVTDEKNPRCHAHKLVGTNCKNGQGTMEIQANSDPISFPNMSILHVTKRKVVDVLTERIVDAIRTDKKLKLNNLNCEPEITDEDRETAKTQAKEQSKNMQLNVVRLCFQVFLRNPDGSFGKMLTPVVSQPIYDSKSPGASALKICRMDKYGGCCSGNEEVFLLCEKVQKDDIQVRFVEVGPDGKAKWESYGNFGPLDVHRQYAIVFKTPAYWNTNIEKAVNVLIMLQRRSDNEVSEPIAFTYFPQNRDKDNIASKKRKRIPLDGYDFGDGGGGGFGGGGAGFGGDSGHDMDDNSNGGGGGGGIRGGNQQLSSQFIIMNNGDISQQRNILPNSTPMESTQPFNLLPRPVEEKILSYGTPNIVDHQGFPCGDLWLASSSSGEIQVDADPVSVCSRDDNFSIPNSPLPPTTSSEKNILSSPPVLETDDVFDSQREIKFDSGVDTHSHKSLFSIDEKKDKKESLSSLDVLSSSSSISGSKYKTETNEKKSVKSSSIVDGNLEVDTKRDYTTGKSDEGFSETSEVAPKIKLINPTEKSFVQTTQKSTESLTLSSDISGTLKRITENVAERTLVALRDYAETGDILHLLLVQRHLMTLNNNNGDLPLHLAIINSQMSAIKSLVKIMSTLPKFKKHVDSYNLMRQTPLHLATILGQQSIVELLLHAGADPSLADRNGNTPAHLAVMNETEQCLKSLVKYVRPGTNKFNPFPELNYLNYEGFSPVHIAAMSSNVSMLQRLVFGKADVDLPDGKSGKTSLHHAVDNDDLAVVRYLLMDNCCDVNARCFDGNTALHIACARQRVGMVALLVSAGADVDIENEEIPDSISVCEDGSKCDRRGHTPMDYADGNEKILSILYKDCDELESSYFSRDFSSHESLQHQMEGMTLQDSTPMAPYMGVTSRGSMLDRDLRSLSLTSRIELSRLLDSKQNDVVALAVKLNNANLSSKLEEISQAGNSPTTFLLEYYESQKGNLATLEESLIAIGRDDVAALLRNSS